MSVQTIYRRSLFKQKRTVRERFVVNSDGVKNGLYTSYHKNGQKSETCTYKNGVKQGADTTWYDNGRMATEAFYKDGCREGIYRSYYPDGTLHIECSFKRDQLDGDYKIYGRNGKLASSYHYSNGFKDGDCVVFNINGQVCESMHYDHDQLTRRIELFGPSATKTMQILSPDSTLDSRIDYVYDAAKLVRRIKYSADLASSYHEVLSPSGHVAEAFHMTGTDKHGSYRMADEKDFTLIEATYDHDLLEGERKIYWPGTRQLKESCPFSKGKENGICYRYNQDGSVLEKCLYIMGQKQINPLMEQLSFEKQVDAADRHETAAAVAKALKDSDKAAATSLLQKFHSASSDVPRRTALKLDKQKTRI